MSRAPDINWDQAARRYREGESIRGLSRRLGVGQPTVRAALLRRGIRTRDWHEATALARERRRGAHHESEAYIPADWRPPSP